LSQVVSIGQFKDNDIASVRHYQRFDEILVPPIAALGIEKAP
jgi:hypothetical protein